MLLSLAEAAERLGVNESRVRQRIAAGSLRAQKVGGRWLLEEADVNEAGRRPPGRPLSSHSAWVLLLLADAIGYREAGAPGRPGPLVGVAPSVRTRSRNRLRALQDRVLNAAAVGGEEARAQVAAVLRNLLRSRAARHVYAASPLDLDDLRADARVVLSGLSHPESGIASGGVVEGYVRKADLHGLVRDYLLVSAQPSGASVFLHILEHDDPLQDTAPMRGRGSPLLLAADLAEHRGPREEARAFELVRQWAEQVTP
jgi:excisionase family DNA binding protein